MSRSIYAILALLFLQGCATAGDLTTLNKSEVHNCVSGFDARGRLVWLTQSSADFETTHVYQSRRSLTAWSAPARLPFSDGLQGGISSSDGRTLLFTSRRRSTIFGDRWNLWTATLTGAVWSEPQPLSEPVNGPHAECCGVLGPSGEIFFSSTRSGSWDIHVARRIGDGHEISRLGSGINSGDPGPPDESGRNGEWPSYVDPSGRFLLFSSIRPGGKGGDDIYVSFKAREGWDPALNLGPEVNTPGYEDCASVTPDGEYFVWSSRKVEKGATSQIRVMPLHELRVFKGSRAGV